MVTAGNTRRLGIGQVLLAARVVSQAQVGIPRPHHHHPRQKNGRKVRNNQRPVSGVNQQCEWWMAAGSFGRRGNISGLAVRAH